MTSIQKEMNTHTYGKRYAKLLNIILHYTIHNYYEYINILMTSNDKLTSNEAQEIISLLNTMI